MAPRPLRIPEAPCKNRGLAPKNPGGPLYDSQAPFQESQGWHVIPMPPLQSVWCLQPERPSSPLPSYNAAIVVAVGLALAVEVDGGVCGHRLGPGEERPGPLASAGRGRHAAQNRAEVEEARVVEP